MTQEAYGRIWMFIGEKERDSQQAWVGLWIIIITVVPRRSAGLIYCCVRLRNIYYLINVICRDVSCKALKETRARWCVFKTQEMSSDFMRWHSMHLKSKSHFRFGYFQWHILKNHRKRNWPQKQNLIGDQLKH